MTIKSLPLRLVAAVALVLAVAALATDLVSTQGRRSGRRSEMLGGREVAAGEVLIRLRSSERAAQIQSFIEQDADADEVESVGRRGLRRMRSRGMNTQALIQMLQQNPEVELVEPNYLLRLDATPNDPSFNNLWGLLNVGQSINGSIGVVGADTSATDAWEITRGSRGSVVGVIDTGIDYTHPDLAANMWSAPSAFSVTIGGLTINCAAGTKGFNAITNTCNPMDDHYHGTHVAGTIGAVGNNGVGVAGVNWVASMMGLKFLSSSGSGWTSDAIKAIEFAVQAKMVFGAAANVRVLNNSWGGGGYSQALKDEIDRAAANDMLFVVAAGNSALNTDVSPQYPSSYPSTNIVSVASTTNRDLLSGFSNYGPTTVHLGAPGSAILSTMPGNTYAYLNGTSMATPHVAGAAALVLAQCPTITTPELKTALLTTVDMIPALAGRTTTGGRLDVNSALRGCRTKVESVTLTSDVPSPRSVGTPITWTATPTGGVTPYAYKWWIYDGATWTMATDWVGSNTLAWTPTAVGNYLVGVWVRSAGNTANAGEVVLSKPYTIMASTTVGSVSMTPNMASPQPVGTMIAWSATPVGGIAPHQYKWWVFDGSAWTAATGWTASSMFTWTPNAVNANYSVRVWARSAGNSVDAAEASATSASYQIIASQRVTSVSLTPSLASPQPVSSAVTWTATPTGGIAPHQYKWLVYNGTSWQFVTGWTTQNTFTWSPSVVGNYLVGVWVKSAGNAADAAETPHSVPFQIIPRPMISSMTIGANQSSPQLSGTTIRLTATASGGVAPYQYRFTITRPGFSQMSAWGADTYDWTPASGGSYTLQVIGRGSGSASDAGESGASMSFAITSPPISSVALSPNRTAPQNAGTAITWTASPTGGTAPYQYKWFDFDGASWVMRLDWSSPNTLVLTPAAANANYAVRVWARSAGNSVDAAEASASVAFAITAPPPLSGLTVVPGLTSPRPVGTGISFSGTFSGGTAPFTYKYEMLFDGAPWMSSGWTTQTAGGFTPNVAGNYTLRVSVRNAGNTTDSADAVATAPFVITSTTVTGVTLTPDRASPQPPGTTITWTALPAGGIAPHQYKWWLYNGVTWTMATDWTASSTFAWTPAVNGTYLVGVWVKSAGNLSNAGETTFSTGYTIAGAVIPRVDQVTLAADRSAPQLPGTTINWTAGAIGGTAPYQFKWALYNGMAWIDLTGWTAQNTLAWTPNVANSAYAIRAWARSAGNNVDLPEAQHQMAFPIGVASPRVIAVTLTPDLASPRAPGTNITWTATPVGGPAPHQYKWWMFDGTVWVMLTDWTTSNQLTWFGNAGNYLIGVWVKSAGNPNNIAEVAHSVPYTIQ